jgi:phospholipid/cholesterol/gamma-HCH transport system substrate-binding protein
MSETKRNLFVGLTVLLGLGALGALAILFGKAPMSWFRSGGYELHVLFPHAAGIVEGTQVTVGGIRVGTVQEIKFVDASTFTGGVRVIVAVEPEYANGFRQGAAAQTMEPGLGMGRPPIEVKPGPEGAPRLASRSEIPGEVTSALDQLIPEELVGTFTDTAKFVGDAADALTPVLEELRVLVQHRTPEEVDQPGGPQGNLASAVARLDESFKQLSSLLGDEGMRGQLKNAVANLEAMTENGKGAVDDFRKAAGEAQGLMSDGREVVAKAGGAIDNINGNVDRVARKVIDVLDSGSRFTSELNVAAAKLNRGEGTLGKLLTDARLYESLVLTFERLGATIEDFRLLVKEWQKGRIRVAL